jgi:cell filamentation protein
VNFVDPYFDENIGDLRNLLGAGSSEELKKLEPQIVFANELELGSVNIPRTNDLDELLLIHRQLFKNVYDWAGQIRLVDIRKNDENAEFFLVVGKISDAANYIFTELVKEVYLKNLPRDSFVARLAYFYDQLNYIHPFREGNGRAQRIFWSRVAWDAGYEINWDYIIGNENDEASRLAAENMDLSKLETMFHRIVSRKLTAKRIS